MVINNAVKISFSALHEWMKQKPSFPTNGVASDEIDTLYFLSMAQSSCNKGTDAWRQDYLTNGITPRELSVNGALMNSDAFASTFKCKAGSAMNPAKKCQVW